MYTAAEAAKKADIIMILINDELQAAMYKKDIDPPDNKSLPFFHSSIIILYLKVHRLKYHMKSAEIIIHQLSFLIVHLHVKDLPGADYD